MLSSARVAALRAIGNPRQSLEAMRTYVTSITAGFRAAAMAEVFFLAS